MKSFLTVAAIGLAAAGFASSASAAGYKFSPPSTKFTGTGMTSATTQGITIACNASLKGNDNANGVGKVTSGSFSNGGGQNGADCPFVTFSGTPWKMKATGPTTATVYGVDFSSPVGSCSGNLPITVQNGVISFNSPLGNCSQVSGTLTTSPTLSIVPK